jgi:hypothetical protein
MLLAAQLQALQTLIGLIEKRIMAQHRFTLANKMAGVPERCWPTGDVLNLQAIALCFLTKLRQSAINDFEQPVYWGPT